MISYLNFRYCSFNKQDTHLLLSGLPTGTKRDRQQALAFRWIITAARKKKGRPMARRLSDELFDAYNKQGAAYTVRENTHKMAESNKAYAHFAW